MLHFLINNSKHWMEMVITWCRAWALRRRTSSEIHSTASRPSAIATVPSPFGTSTCNSASLTKSSTRRRCAGSLTLLMATSSPVLATTHKYISVIQWTSRKFQLLRHLNMKTKLSRLSGIPICHCYSVRQQIRQQGFGIHNTTEGMVAVTQSEQKGT